MHSRALEPELMDDPALPPSEHAHALRGLARINFLSGAGAQIRWAMSRATRIRAGDSLSILDLATGSGDVLCDVAKRFAARKVAVRLTACDVSPFALEQTRARLAAIGLAVQLMPVDVLRDGLPLPDRSVDVVMCSLFLHHLPDSAIPTVLRECARVASKAVVISDLRRCRRGLWAAHAAGRLLTRSRIVRVDAVRSVRAALTPQELQHHAASAGLSNMRISKCFPLRMLGVWTRD